MKITEINIPKSSDDGLEEIYMSRLDNIVLLAGKNGAGKTRILNKIFQNFKKKPPVSRIAQLLSEIKIFETQIRSRKQSIDGSNRQLQSSISDAEKEKIKQSIEGAYKKINQNAGAIKERQSDLNWDFVKTDVSSDKYSFVYFVPKKLDLADSSGFSKNDILRRAEEVKVIGIKNLPQGAFAKIQMVQDRYYNTSHPESDASPEDIQNAKEEYDKLKEIIYRFLGTDITRTQDGEATLFKLPFKDTNLSDGQKVLLQLCIAIYSQGVGLNDLILVLDEPENHLHPSVIIETIERIQECVVNGQIWIATHSVPLLAHFDPSLLWYVESGKIMYAGKTPEKVLHSLLGGDNEIAKLQDFISLPAQFATSRFAFESLFEPGTVMTDAGDPQSLQIKGELQSISSNGKLRILDYGAGKGRFISNIFDLDKANRDNLLEKIEYIAFDKYPADKAHCETILVKVFGTSDKKYYNDFTSLFSDYDKGTFDVVIMCNVLHEIDPNDWLKLFQPDGEIPVCLKENGVLLLVEDCQMPIGEMAYQKGFLVLDTPAVKDLFQITGADSGFCYSTQGENRRLTLHRIPRNLLIRIKPQSRIKAIDSIARTAQEQILAIRKEEKNYKNGKIHGFLTQQYANAMLNLAVLKGSD